jgi:hypothetical protein
LRAGDGLRIHRKLEGNIEGAIVGHDLFLIISILLRKTLECLVLGTFFLSREELDADVSALRIELPLGPERPARDPARHHISNYYVARALLYEKRSHP